MAALCVGTVACGDDSDNPAKPAQTKVLEVGVDDDGNGDCLLIEEPLEAEVEKLPTIDCEQEHTHEVFASIPYQDPANPDAVVDVFPGLSALGEFAQRACFTEFEVYVGISPFDSVLVPSWLLPTLDGWNDEDDRDVLCVVANPQVPRMIGSVRGTKQ